MIPEQKALADLVGTWDTAMEAGGEVSRGTTVYTLEVGGRWLVSAVEGELHGRPFSGKGLQAFDPASGKFVYVWVDSTLPVPSFMEGTADPATGARTLTGSGPAAGGPPTTYRSVTEMLGADEMVMTMYSGAAPEPMFVSTYTRRK